MLSDSPASTVDEVVDEVACWLFGVGMCSLRAPLILKGRDLETSSIAVR